MTKADSIGDSSQLFFSIVTPTYNRVRLLERLYQSLVDQRFSSMEWVVVDDGSLDGTETLMRRLQSESPFPIVYQWQKNGGKHRALNHALQLCRGRFFVDIDSDDYFLPGALQAYHQLWQDLPPARQTALGGMVADCVHVDGRTVGRPFPQDRMITNSIALRARLKVRGDKLYLYKLDVAQQFPSPEFPGEHFMQESVRHRRIARSYDLLATTHAGRVKDYQSDGLSAEASGRLPNSLRNPRGYRLRTLEATNFRAKENWRELWKECANYVRFSFHCGESLPEQARQVDSKVLWALSVPVGYARYRRDLRRFPQLSG